MTYISQLLLFPIMIFFLSLHEIYSIAHLLKLHKTLLWSLMIKKAYNSKKLTITFSGVTLLKKIGFFSLAGIQQQEINHNIFRCQIIQKNSGFFSLAVPVHVFLAVKVGVGSFKKSFKFFLYISKT